MNRHEVWGDDRRKHLNCVARRREERKDEESRATDSSVTPTRSNGNRKHRESQSDVFMTDQSSDSSSSLRTSEDWTLAGWTLESLISHECIISNTLQFTADQKLLEMRRHEMFTVKKSSSSSSAASLRVCRASVSFNVPHVDSSSALSCFFIVHVRVFVCWVTTCPSPN